MGVEVYKALGRRIVALREDRGWTQEQLAEAVDTAAPYVSRIERAGARPTIDMLTRIAKALEVPLWRLFAPPGLTRGERALAAAERELAEVVAGLPAETVRALVEVVRKLRAG